MNALEVGLLPPMAIGGAGGANRLRDIETPRDVFDRRQFTVVEPDLNEDPQREIGMKRYTHFVSARPLSALPNVTGLPNFNEQG